VTLTKIELEKAVWKLRDENARFRRTIVVLNRKIAAIEERQMVQGLGVDEEVRNLRMIHARLYGAKYRQLAEEFGVSCSRAGQIIQRFARQCQARATQMESMVKRFRYVSGDYRSYVTKVVDEAIAFEPAPLSHTPPPVEPPPPISQGRELPSSRTPPPTSPLCEPSR
jgi:hypothetical protein